MDQTALSFFVNAVVSAVAFFVAGHKTMFKHDLAQLDMAFRKCDSSPRSVQLTSLGVPPPPPAYKNRGKQRWGRGGGVSCF